MPCATELLKTAKATPSFLELADYERLLDAAAKTDARTHVIALLGGDAGLRRGEMLGLRWVDVDFARRQLLISQGVWEGKDGDDTTRGSKRRFIDVPKGGRGRVVPMTDVLHDALKRFRHLRGELVFHADDARPATSYQLRTWFALAHRRASLPQATGGLHVPRHTFRAHLPTRGAPAHAIQARADPCRRLPGIARSCTEALRSTGTTNPRSA